tara:strand:+ start:1053 stop:1436 length:384 start_codon:yes stop_codon:yes gene_type:complete
MSSTKQQVLVSSKKARNENKPYEIGKITPIFEIEDKEYLEKECFKFLTEENTPYGFFEFYTIRNKWKMHGERVKFEDLIPPEARIKMNDDEELTDKDRENLEFKVGDSSYTLTKMTYEEAVEKYCKN